MEPIAKVVYPPPPPTTNNLTTKQRSLLLRKAKKIEQILGYPPHLTDTLYNTDGTTASSPFAAPTIGPSEDRSSLESSTSTLVCLDTLEDKDGPSWFWNRHNNGFNQIPLLRVASKSLRLELTAVTNWPAKPSATMSVSEQLQGPCTPPPDPELQLKSSFTDPVIVVPTFTIPSSLAHRKAKMDRIRKRLGSEVPYEVVFPEDVERGPSDSSERPMPHAVELDRPLPTLPGLPPASLSTPSHKHLECRRPPVVHIANVKPANEKLPLIPENPDESAGEFTVDFSRTKDGSLKRRDTADSRLSICTQSSDGQGVVSFRKRPKSYRKPPPPILDASFCSF